MKKLLLTFLIILFSLTSNLVKANETLDIQDVEKIGFIKEYVKGFEMIGAIDGWYGTLSDEKVEIYVYKDVSSIPVPFFDAAKDMGWEEVCFVSNLALMSKGKTACTHLSSLSTE